MEEKCLVDVRGSEVKLAKLLGDAWKGHINSNNHWLQPPTKASREAALDAQHFPSGGGQTRAFKVSRRLSAATLK